MWEIVGVSVLQTHLSLSFFHWVILLYHPQVILEKQKGSMKRKPFSRWCGQPLGFQDTPN
jgi:hypothetical protein